MSNELGITMDACCDEHPFEYRIGFLGCPEQPKVKWNAENVAKLKALGFNTLQLNIAWGSRPNEEPLNLEDLFDVPADLVGATKKIGDQSPECRAKRLRVLHERSDLCKNAGLRTVFHFGAPYVGDIYLSDAPDNCLLDGKTIERCKYLLRKFAQEYPEIDDILIYTYDQHAWLCSEFGPCPRCTGIPLMERVIPFLEEMGRTWRQSHPAGRLWWEPWELSAGQVQQCIERVDTEGFGLALHCNIAEVIAVIPVDRWLKNCCQLASARGIPVIVEYWLGGPTEELEPYLHLSSPLVTLRGLNAIADVPGVCGIKEYFGLIPDKEDPNLRMTGLFFAHPAVSEDQALAHLAEPYGSAKGMIIEFWRLTSSSMELFPWDISWMMRRIGRSSLVHSMNAAFIQGVPWHTPSWESTRRAIYMKSDNSEPDEWMLEDVQLRCELAAARMKEALVVGCAAKPSVPKVLAADFERNLQELNDMRRHTLAYVFHLRETNLAATMRVCREHNIDIPQRSLDELLAVLKNDQENQGQQEPIGAAIDLLQKDIDEFLKTYFTLTSSGTLQHRVGLTAR